MTKILHLVLYSRSAIYDKMKEVTYKYYSTVTGLYTIYYLFSEEIVNNYELIDNMLYIKGKETYIPGILDKTIKAFEFFSNNISDYDFIIRSNVSTIINFQNLFKYSQLSGVQKQDSVFKKLKDDNISYGGLVWNLNWTQPGCGIVDDTHFNTKYISGTCIIFDKKTFTTVLLHKKYIDYNIIDDVAIGILIKNYCKSIIPTSLPVVFTKDWNIDLNITDIKDVNEYIIYRNHSGCGREKDIRIMENLIKYLLKNIDEL